MMVLISFDSIGTCKTYCRVVTKMTYSIDELRSMQMSGNYRGLIFALSTPDALVRAEAMVRMSSFTNGEVRDAAIRHLAEDSDYNVRAQACVVLRHFPGSDEIVDALCEALRDSHRLVRERAAFALTQLRAREALCNIMEMADEGVEPDISDTVNMAIEVLSEPDKSETLVDLVTRKDVEGIGELFDCLLKADHDEIERGLERQGKNRMLDIFRDWEHSGRLTALEPDPSVYVATKKKYAKRLIEAAN